MTALVMLPSVGHTCHTPSIDSYHGNGYISNGCDAFGGALADPNLTMKLLLYTHQKNEHAVSNVSCTF